MRIQPQQWTAWDRVRGITQANTKRAMTWFSQQVRAISNLWTCSNVGTA